MVRLRFDSVLLPLVSCFEPVYYLLHVFSLLYAAHSTVSVRLVGGTTSRGRVEILYDNTWGTICDDYFTNQSAGVLCHMLGFSRSVLSIWHLLALSSTCLEFNSAEDKSACLIYVLESVHKAQFTMGYSFSLHMYAC